MTKIEAYRKDVSDKAKEINALKSQLAAERDAFQKLVNQNTSYREALAAERERADSRTLELEQMAGRYNRDVKQLRAQLAAAQAALARYRKALDALYNHNEAVRHAVAEHFGLHHDYTDTTALDAAIAEAQNPLVDALAEIRGLVTLRRIHQIVDAALAKVGNQ